MESSRGGWTLHRFCSWDEFKIDHRFLKGRGLPLLLAFSPVAKGRGQHHAPGIRAQGAPGNLGGRQGPE